jgi:uncharacterized protein (UPF0212 family)
METLSVADGFDVHEYREGMKIRKQDRDSIHLENRAGYACPACGRQFDRLFVSTDDDVTFGSAPNGPICVVRAPERLLVLTH